MFFFIFLAQLLLLVLPLQSMVLTTSTPKSKIPLPTVTPTISPTVLLSPSPTLAQILPTATSAPIKASFPPLPASDQPFGMVTITCDAITGFAFDPRSPGTAIRWVMNYKSPESNNLAFDGNGGYAGNADQPSPEVNAFYNLEGNHGIYYKLDNFYKINYPVTYTVTAYSQGSRPELLGSPKTLTCSPS